MADPKNTDPAQIPQTLPYLEKDSPIPDAAVLPEQNGQEPTENNMTAPTGNAQEAPQTPAEL